MIHLPTHYSLTPLHLTSSATTHYPLYRLPPPLPLTIPSTAYHPLCSSPPPPPLTTSSVPHHLLYHSPPPLLFQAVEYFGHLHAASLATDLNGEPLHCAAELEAITERVAGLQGLLPAVSRQLMVGW